MLMGRLQLVIEDLDINPDIKRRLDEVRLVPVDHHSDLPGRRAQGLPKPMDDNIEAVARGVGRYFGPEHAHQSIPPYLAVTIDEQVLEYRATSSRGPGLDRTVLKGNVQLT